MTAVSGSDPAHPLQALAKRMRTAAHSMPFARPLGEVRAVGPSAIEIAGLSRAAALINA